MRKIFLLSWIFLVVGCGSYSISKESFVDQVGNKNISKTQNVASLGTSYNSNNLSQIRCFDKNGKEVIITPNKNTTFSITNSKTGEKINLYFDTVILSNDSISGLKSRILGGKKSIALKDISNIMVKTEN